MEEGYVKRWGRDGGGEISGLEDSMVGDGIVCLFFSFCGNVELDWSEVQ